MKIGIYLAAGIAALSVAACTPKTTGTPETNPALETIFSRTSIRTYQDRTVEPQKIELLLRAAMSAPSGKDQRPWEFVVVNERPILDSLAAALPYAKMLAQAPCAVIVCGSPARSSYWYLDCSAAAENILLAAHSLGLGGVWTAAYPYAERMEAVRSNLALPRESCPCASFRSVIRLPSENRSGSSTPDGFITTGGRASCCRDRRRNPVQNLLRRAERARCVFLQNRILIRTFALPFGRKEAARMVESVDTPDLKSCGQ